MIVLEAAETKPELGAEALIRQARRRQRRRWTGLAAAVLIAMVSGIAVHLSSAARTPARTTTGSKPMGPKVTVAAYPTCLASRLRLSTRAYNVDMTGAYAIYSITNIGSAPCALAGTPLFSATDSAARAVGTVQETYANTGRARATSGTAERRVVLWPGGHGSFAAWWQNCPDALPSAQVKIVTLTSSWTFVGQSSGITQVTPDAAVGCKNVPVVVSQFEAGVMSHPPWVPTPSAGSPGGFDVETEVFGP